MLLPRLIHYVDFLDELFFKDNNAIYLIYFLIHYNYLRGSRI